MTSILVIGAGVIGQSYAGFLAAGDGSANEVTVVARGARASELRSAQPHAPAVRLEHGGRLSTHSVAVVEHIEDAPPADVLIVAVRGDQLPEATDAVAARGEQVVVCLANPLGFRDEFRRRVGAERTVFAFAGVGGTIVDGVVHYHEVREQPTVVDVGAPHGIRVAELMADAALTVRRERSMAAWLDTHTLFIAGIGSALLACPGGSAGLARSRPGVRTMVLGLAEAFDALQRSGVPVRPVALRMIFGRVPIGFATRYWMKQCGSATITLAIEPHVLATRGNEFPLLVERARHLAGEAAPRFARVLDAGAAHP